MLFIALGGTGKYTEMLGTLQLKHRFLYSQSWFVKCYKTWDILRRGEREGAEWVVREGVGVGGRNEPSLVCTYE
jgi:hypothetical protein